MPRTFFAWAVATGVMGLGTPTCPISEWSRDEGRSIYSIAVQALMFNHFRTSV